MIIELTLVLIAINCCIITYTLITSKIKQPLYEFTKLQKEVELSVKSMQIFNHVLLNSLDSIQSNVQELDILTENTSNTLKKYNNRLSDYIEEHDKFDIIEHVRAIRETTDKLSKAICDYTYYGYALKVMKM